MNTNESSKSNNGTTSKIIKNGSGKAFGFMVNSSTNGEIALIDSTTNDGVAKKAETSLFLNTGFLQATPTQWVFGFSEDNVVDGQTISLGNIVYTFRNTPTASYDTRIGADIAETSYIFSQTVQGISEWGVDCGFGTFEHPIVNCFYIQFEPTDPYVLFIFGKTFDYLDEFPIDTTTTTYSILGFGESVSKERASFTVGGKTYCFVALFSEEITAKFNGTEFVFNTIVPNEIKSLNADGIVGAVNGTQGIEGEDYSRGTTPNTQVDAEYTTGVKFIAKNVGSYGNSIAISTPPEAEFVVLGTANNEPQETLLGGQDAPNSFMGSFPFASDSDIVKFPAPLEFYQGLYAVITGDIDYTILYE